MDNKKNISVIIPVCNNLVNLQNVLALLRICSSEFIREIIVVDNHSDPDVRKWLQIQPDIDIICNDENKGSAVAFNQGAAKAKGEYILFMHSDVYISLDAIPNAIKAMQIDERIGIVGVYTNRSKQRWQSINIQDKDKYSSIESMMDYASQRKKVPENNTYTVVVEDFFMLVRNVAYQAVQGFDEKFTYSSWADFDLSLRMQMAGYVCYLVDEFVHHDADSYDDNNWDSRKIISDNKHYFKEKWYTDPLYATNVRTDILQFINLGKTGLKLLDVGCSCGGNLMTIRQVNPSADLYGIEYNERMAQVASCYGRVHVMDVEKIEFKDWHNKFDYIICGDVLEHLHNPWKTLTQLGKYLNKEGKIIISLPNINHISIIAQIMSGVWNYEEAGILDKTHLRFFTKKTAIEMVEKAGLLPLESYALTISLNNELLSWYKKLTQAGLHTVPDDEMLAFQWLIIAVKKKSNLEELKIRHVGRILR